MTRPKSITPKKRRSRIGATRANSVIDWLFWLRRKVRTFDSALDRKVLVGGELDARQGGALLQVLGAEAADQPVAVEDDHDQVGAGIGAAADRWRAGLGPGLAAALGVVADVQPGAIDAGRVGAARVGWVGPGVAVARAQTGS